MYCVDMTWPLVCGPSTGGIDTSIGCAPRWWLLQANREAAGQVLALAHRLGLPDADSWAAGVMAHAASSGAASDGQVLRAAQLVALGRQVMSPREPAIFSAEEIRSLAIAHAHDRSRPQTEAGTPGNPIGHDWRDAHAARAAFNFPAHWLDTGDGRVAPDPSRLEGESASAWNSLTRKFGPEFATTLFDAKARGGNTTAVIDAMQVAGSKLTLTVRDLARLQFVCLTDGKATPGVSWPSLHDTLHSYGTSMFEEMYGDAHTEGLVRSLFATDAPGKIDIDAGKSLGAQPLVVRALKTRIQEDFGSVTLANLAFETRAAFYQTDDIGYESFKHRWYETPSQNASQMEQVLERSGALAHLGVAIRARVNSLIHDAADPNSFASISRELDRALAASPMAGSMFPPKFKAWLSRLNDLVREDSANQMMSTAQFSEHAAQAIAMSLVLERAASGSMILGPARTLLGDDMLARPLQSLDLRTSYPAALREVRQALGLSP